jgi:molecular chaperone DnaK
MIYQVEKQMHEMGGVSDSLRLSVEARVTELRQAMQGEDINRIRELSEQLQHAVTETGKGTDQSSSSNGQDQNGGSPEGEVIEGEFTQA